MESTQDLLMGLAFVTSIVLIVFAIARYNYLIKKAMIDRGLTEEQSNTKLPYLDFGCIVLGLGIGLVVSSVFTTMNMKENTMELLVWGTILIFGSIGLVLAHFIRRKLGN